MVVEASGNVVVATVVAGSLVDDGAAVVESIEDDEGADVCVESAVELDTEVVDPVVELASKSVLLPLHADPMINVAAAATSAQHCLWRLESVLECRLTLVLPLPTTAWSARGPHLMAQGAIVSNSSFTPICGSPRDRFGHANLRIYGSATQS